MGVLDKRYILSVLNLNMFMKSIKMKCKSEAFSDHMCIKAFASHSLI